MRADATNATDATDATDATRFDAQAPDAASGARDSSTLLDASQLDDDQGAPLEDAALPDPLVLGKSSSAGAALDLDNSTVTHTGEISIWIRVSR